MISVNTPLKGTQWHNLVCLWKQLYLASIVDILEKYVFTRDSTFHILYPINIILKQLFTSRVS